MSSLRLSRNQQTLFDDENIADKAAEIGQAILAAHSLRLTDIAAKMKGSSDASYKRIQRFVQQADPRQALWRLFQEQAEFAIGDPNEIERPHPGRQTKKIYFARVKIDETFRDLKSLLGMTKLMNYSRGKWKRCWRCYCLCSPSKEKDKKWKRYSGLFILLKQN